MRVVAIVECSNGNETVGEMWQETSTFEETSTLQEVFKWAIVAHGGIEKEYPRIRATLKLTIDQSTIPAEQFPF